MSGDEYLEEYNPNAPVYGPFPPHQNTQRFWEATLLEGEMPNNAFNPGPPTDAPPGYKPPETPEDQPYIYKLPLMNVPYVPGTKDKGLGVIVAPGTHDDPSPKDDSNQYYYHKPPPLGLGNVSYESSSDTPGEDVPRGTNDYLKYYQPPPGFNQEGQRIAPPKEADPVEHLPGYGLEAHPGRDIIQPLLGEAPKDEKPATNILTPGWIRGRSTLWGLQPDGITPDPGDADDPRGEGAFKWAHTRDPSYDAVAIPPHVLNAAFGHFIYRNPNGTYGIEQTPEALDAIQRIRNAKVDVLYKGKIYTHPIGDIGPGDHTGNVIDFTFGARKKMGMTDNEQVSYIIRDGDGTPLPVDQSAMKDDKSPLGTVRRLNPQNSNWSDEEIIQSMHAKVAPRMPLEEFSQMARSQQGMAAFNEALSHPPSKMDQFMALPGFQGMTEDQVAHTVYDAGRKSGQISKGTDFDTFRDEIQPPSGLDGLAKSFQSQAASAGDSFLANFYQTLGSATASLDSLREIFNWAIGPDNVKALKQWTDFTLSDEKPAITNFQELAGKIMNLSDQYQAKAQARAQEAARVKGLEGFLGKVAGGLAGSAPEVAMTTAFPGTKLSTGAKMMLAATWGLASNSTHIENAKGYKDYANQLERGAMNATQSLLINTPAGRIASGTLVAALGLPTDDIKAWVQGKPGAATATFETIATDWLLGALFSKAAEKGPYRTGLARYAAGGYEPPPMPPPSGPSSVWPPQLPSGPTHMAGPEGFTLGPSGPPIAPPPDPFGEEPSGWKPTEVPNNGGVSPEVHEEITKAWHARIDGDIPKTKEHADRAVALMPDEDKKALGDISVEAVKAGQKGEYISGTTLHVEFPKKSETVPFQIRGEDVPELTPEFKNQEEADSYHNLPEEDRAQYRRHLAQTDPVYRAKDQSYRATKETNAKTKTSSTGNHFDHFYSGFGAFGDIFNKFVEDFLPKARGAARRVYEALPGLQSTVQGIKKTFGGVYSETSQIGEALLRGARARAEQEKTALPGQAARAEGLQNVQLGKFLRMVVTGVRGERRHAFFHQYTDSELKRFIAAAEQNKPINDPKAARLFKFYRAGYDAIYKLDQAWGIHYNLRNNYVFHALKRPEEWDKFTKQLSGKGINPDFVNARQFKDVVEMLHAGYELKTYNPEELFQLRLAGSLREIERLDWLNQLKELGLAYRSDEKGYPGPNSGWGEHDAADRHNWKIDPELEGLWNNAFGRSKMWDMIGKGPGAFFRAARGLTSSIRLAWSLFHLGHILRIRAGNSLTSVWQRLLSDEKSTGAEWQRDLTNVLTSGLKSVVTDLRDYRNVLAHENGMLDESKLTPQQRQFIEYKNEAGLNMAYHRDQEIRFSNNIATYAKQALLNDARKQGKNALIVEQRGEQAQQVAKQFDRTLTSGYRFLTASAPQRWLFGHLIPSLKMSAFSDRLNTLFREHPELRDDVHSVERKIALTRIGKEIEGQFGEMFYSNLFWDKTAKDIGTSSLLSLGWQLGALRIYGGAIHDLTDNLIHFDEITKAGGLFSKAGARKFLTDRILYATSYSLLSAFTNAVIQYAYTKKLPNGIDYAFPQIGTNPDGTPKRVNTPDFTREWPTLMEHIRHEGPIVGTWTMIQNKLQSLVASTAQTLRNSNYYGQEIYSKDPNAPWVNKMWDSVSYIFMNSMVPIPVAQTLQSRPGMSAPFQSNADLFRAGAWQNWGNRIMSFDTMMSFLGYSPAPQWTQRSQAENDIVAAYAREHGHSTSVESQGRHDALTVYRNAVLSGDQQQMRDAYSRAKAAGLSDRTLANTAKFSHTPMSVRLLPLLSPDEQARQVARMTPEERLPYLRVMRPAGKAALEKLLQSERRPVTH